MTTPRTYSLTQAEAAMAFGLVSSHTQALKNWMASAVERGDLPSAQKLVKELRAHQDLYGKLNVEAHKTIDEARNG